MTSAIRQLTGVGGDIRKIARLLQKKAPEGHFLAYINQEEADLLKQRGGSGKPHENTGIPSFDEGEDLLLTSQPEEKEYIPYRMDYRTPETTANAQEFKAAPAVAPGKLGSGTYDFETPYVSAAAPPPTSQVVTTPSAGFDTPTTQIAQPKGDESLLGRASKALGMSEETLGKLGIGGLQAYLGSIQAKKAQEQGQAGKEEIKTIASPYQAQGKALQEQAQRGELTAVGQQQLQAVQAQAADAAQRRGGVGAQQIGAQVEAFRQQLLQNQYDYGLKLSGIGDNIALGAIKTGLEADRYVNTLTSNYYTNIARTMYGQAPQVAGQPASTTPAG
jgi:hypothetical protein